MQLAGTFTLCTLSIYSDKADINLGVPFIIVLAITVLFNSLLAATFFGENLHAFDWAGILVINVGIIFVTFGAAAHEGDIAMDPERDMKAFEKMSEEGIFHLSALMRFVETAAENLDPKFFKFTFGLITLLELSVI